MDAARFADVTRFIDAISSRDALLGDLFAAERPIHVARAPGRLDVMGGIADYSGSLVLEGTLAEATVCGVQLRDDRTVRVQSLNARGEGLAPDVSRSLDDLVPASGANRYEAIRARFHADPSRAWAAYVAGAFAVLVGEKVVPGFPRGATIAVQSEVPLGAGVSSSAALEVAAMTALAAAYGIAIPGLRLAALCQIVENSVVGAPCGIMDQVTSALGEAGKLLALRCRPHDVEGVIALPPGIRAVGFDTHVKHAVGGSRYTDTRVAAFMGQRIIAGRRTKGEGPPGPAGGYLTAIAPEEYVARWRPLLPARMKGEEFLRIWGGTFDPVTRVVPEKTYLVRSRTEHPIYENARVERFRACLIRALAADAGSARVEREMVRAGKLMYGSHWSYGSRCAMGSRETDLVVRMVRPLGPHMGFYGAKITGGGSGGTVAILCREGTDADLARMAAQYRAATGLEPRLFLGTGPGACEFGTRVVNGQATCPRHER